MGTILAILGWLAAAILGEIALSSAYRAASARWRFLPRWSPRAADGGALLPELAGSACAIILTLLGALPALAGILIATALFLFAEIPQALVMWQAAHLGRKQALYAARRIASMQGLLAWTARSFFAEDLRSLGGLLHRDPSGDAAVAPPAGTAPRAPAPAGAPASPPARWPAAVRQVPPLRDNAALGDAPAAAEVGISLEAAGVLVLPEAAALASVIGEFDPDDDEDELLGFVATLAASFVVIFEAFPDLAETLLTGTGLDPAYAIGFIDIGDEGGGLVEAFALLDRQYHQVYEDVHGHVESGKTLPHNSRAFFHAGGDAPEDGTAA
jgi:hypothetical protein